GCDALPLTAPADPTTNNSFTATCTTALTSANSSMNVVAGYSGDDAFAPNGAVLVQKVNKASTTTVASSSSPDPSAIGQPVTFTATVAPVAPGAGTPSGTVAFSDGTNPVTCTGGPPALDGNGAATC